MASPDWTSCTVRHVLLPTLQMLDKEIEAREAAYNRTVGHLKPLPTVEHDFDVEGFVEVERAYEDVRAKGEKARRRSVVTAWQEWVVGDELLLPDRERTYRQAIHVHERAVKRLDARLTSHRGHVESVKAATKRVIHEYRDLASTIIPICTKAIQSITKSVYGERTLEPIPYQGFQHPARVIFGTESTPEFVVRVLQELQEREGVVNISPWEPVDVKKAAFELEQRCFTQEVEDVVKGESLEDLKRHVVFGLLSNPPLIPLSDGDIKRLSLHLPRDELALRINAQSPHTTSILSLLFNLPSGQLPDLNTAPILVSHRPNAATIVSRIYASWDFESDWPLADGVERRWDSRYGPHLWNTSTNTFVVEETS